MLACNVLCGIYVVYIHMQEYVCALWMLVWSTCMWVCTHSHVGVCISVYKCVCGVRGAVPVCVCMECLVSMDVCCTHGTREHVHALCMVYIGMYVYLWVFTCVYDMCMCMCILYTHDVYSCACALCACAWHVLCMVCTWCFCMCVVCV